MLADFWGDFNVRQITCDNHTITCNNCDFLLSITIFVSPIAGPDRSPAARRAVLGWLVVWEEDGFVVLGAM